MQTETKAAIALDLEMPPSGGDLAIQTLEDEAHALRVMLDKSENFKAAVGQRLLELLNNRFAGNRNALRDWYEDQVVEGKAHRAWSTVQPYLSAVITHGEQAVEVLAERTEKDNQRRLRSHERDRETISRARSGSAADNDINALETPQVSEYEKRKQWLAHMDYLWFRGEPEWRKKWLEDRGLKSAHPL